MDLKKTGEFIAELRKEKNLTQQALAEKIFVSEKTISKWECGKGFPDTSLILPLCEVLDISANELLAGQKLSKEEYKQKAEENIVELAKQNVQKDKLLLKLEWVLMVPALVMFLVLTAIAAYANISETLRVVLIVIGLVFIFPACFFAIKIEADAGYYECKKCGHRHIPTYGAVLRAHHIGRTRLMKCPNCGQKSWQKKKVENKEK